MQEIKIKLNRNFQVNELIALAIITGQQEEDVVLKIDNKQISLKSILGLMSIISLMREGKNVCLYVPKSMSKNMLDELIGFLEVS